MLIRHPLRKGCLALGVLVGALLLAGDVRAASKRPIVPAMVEAQALLESSSNPALQAAAAQVEQALLSLAGPAAQDVFRITQGRTTRGGRGGQHHGGHGKGSGSSGSSSSGKSDRQIAFEALALLRSAETQLQAMQGGSRIQRAISHLQAAQVFIDLFLFQS
jgi:hypothetical protein